MKTCTCCAKRELHIFQMGCPSCEARHLARMTREYRQQSYRIAQAKGVDLEALKARVKSEWDLDQKGKAA